MLTKWRSRHADYWRVYHAIRADPSSGTIVVVRSRSVHQTTFLFGVTRELPAVFTVFAAAASALRDEHNAAGYVLAGAEVIAGAGVLVAIALEARHLFVRQGQHADAGSHRPPRVDMTSLAAAALGYVEAWHHARVVGELQLVSPSIIGATLSLLIARFKSRASSKGQPLWRSARQLHVAITPVGISYLAGPRRKWRAEWTDVVAVEHGRGELAIRLHDGRRHVLRADEHLEGEKVIAETRAAIAAHAPQVPGAVGVTKFAGPGASARAAQPKASV